MEEEGQIEWEWSRSRSRSPAQLCSVSRLSILLFLSLPGLGFPLQLLQQQGINW